MIWHEKLGFAWVYDNKKEWKEGIQVDSFHSIPFPQHCKMASAYVEFGPLGVGCTQRFPHYWQHRLFSTDLWSQRSPRIVRIESLTLLRYSNARTMELPRLRTRYIDLLFCCGRKTLNKNTSHQCSSTLHESGIHSKMTCILFVSLKFKGPVESQLVV